MLRSADRILTTHVGSLPRSQAVTDVLFARENGGELPSNPDKVIADAVADIVRRQVEVGIDIAAWRMGRSLRQYIRTACRADGDTPRERGRTSRASAAAGKLASWARRRSTAPRPAAPRSVKDLGPMREDIANLTAAVAAAMPTEAFINTASPGTIALFQPNEHYATQDAYLEAVAEGMRAEYEGLTQAGLLIQIDAPDLAMGRQTMYRNRRAARRPAALHISCFTTRSHVPATGCHARVLGNYEGPHTHACRENCCRWDECEGRRRCCSAANPRQRTKACVPVPESVGPTTRSSCRGC